MLSTSPASGKKRTVVTIQGANFVPHQTVTVTYLAKTKYTVLCKATVGANAAFTCTGKIPSGRRGGKRGQHTIEAKQSSGTRATAKFMVTN
jgi:hypothetical protein